MTRRLPVTLVGGFLGAGKTSLLHHFISEHRGGYLAVLVENPGVLNLDARAFRGLCGAMRRTNDTVLAIPDGDEAAQMEWITGRLREICLAARYERVLIEVSGTSTPAWLARQAEAFSEWAELRQAVCVVDALDYFRLGKSESAARPATWDFQNEQIAGASLVVLNKCDLLNDRELDLCRKQLGWVSPLARVVETAFGEMPPDVLFDPTSAREWESVLARQPPFARDDVAERPLSSVLYRVHRPFHPARFWDWFNSDHPGLLRMKGIIWLATRNLLVGGISRTSWQNSCGAAGLWWAALPREDWPQEPEALMRMQETWREPFGDRRQELVLVGDAAQVPTPMQSQLDACLLTAEEYARPLSEWQMLPDPFPAWGLEDGSG